MTIQYASLDHIENNRNIHKETDYEFMHNLQTGLLLALKEQGRLNETQYFFAQERLDRQRQKWMKKLQQKGQTE